MEYMKFRLRSFTVPAPMYHLFCGSNYELPYKFHLYSDSDVDQLLYCYDICAIPWNRKPPKNTKCTILRIDSSNTPSGYARLKVDGGSARDKPSYYRRPRMLGSIESGGPAMQSLQKCGPTAGRSVDDVFAICCPYWPVEAKEWRTRKRFHGWPNEKLIARITRGGCHFVSKLRTWSSCDDTEWRFSFSKTELLLIHSWTDVQKTVYHIIRLIKKAFSECCGGDGKKRLQTYYFKTLMFWACEEFPQEFWKEENTITCVKTLLLQFVRCLNEKYCPSYFIPDCNIMSHLKDEESFEEELQVLYNWSVSESVNLACNKIMSAKKEVLSSLNCFEFHCLKQMSSSFPINENSNGRVSPYLVQCEWFLPGMRKLHAEVEAHLRLMSLDNVTSRKESKDYAECFEHFKCSLISNEDFNSFKYLNPELSMNENFTVIFFRKLTKNSIPIYRRQFRSSFEKDAYERKYANSLPPILFYVESAYRANFYFTAMQSYKESLAEFNRCVDVINKAGPEAVCGDKDNLIACIPVLICNSLSQIFDEHIQVILGFATLHRNISVSLESPNSSTALEVCLKLNAWEFLKYLYIQCEHKLSAVSVPTTWFSSSRMDFSRPSLSKLTRNEPYSAAILFAALRQSRAYAEPLKGIFIPHHF